MKIATRYKQKFLVKLTMVLVPAQLVSAQQTSGLVANIITEVSDQENFPIGIYKIIVDNGGYEPTLP